MEYSVTVWHTPIREWKEGLYRLTYRREWVLERNCWRDVVVRQERCEESGSQPAQPISIH